MRLGAGVAWLGLAGAAAAQVEDPMEVQRCIWRCLADSPGAESRQYNDCVALKCSDPALSGGDTPAPAQLPGTAATPMAAPTGSWTWGATAEGMFAGVIDAARGSRLDWICAKGRPSYLALSPYRGDGGFLVTAGVRSESYAVEVQNGVAYAAVDLTSPLFGHIASGPSVAVTDGTGQVLGEFAMSGAAMAIGQAEGRCR